MAEAPAPRRHSPLESFAPRFEAAGRDDTVRLRERPFLAMVDLRLGAAQPGMPEPPGATGAAGAAGERPEVFARVEEATGAPVPRTPGASGDAHRGVLWLGPDWWLVFGPPGTEGETAARLRAALGEDHGSVVDVSAQRTALELTGPRARDVLVTGCSVDLHPWSFPAGACAQTLLARTQVVLHHLNPGEGPAPAYRVLVRASFAPYLAEWLLDAMTEHT